MKILVIGNGFDLAHYLPTKYSQFISVLQAIEKLPDDKEEINFNDLFGDLSINESWFFDRTRELYAIDEIRFDRELILGIKEKLRENIWYAYFKHHLAEIETWIDFETKILEALEVVSNFYQTFYEKKEEKGSNFDPFVVKSLARSGIYLDKMDIDHLLSFNIITVVTMVYKPGYGIRDIYLDNTYKELKFDKILIDLKSSLDIFIEIFDLYLSGVVSKFKVSFSKFDKVFDNLDLVYSFNYTSTFLNFYPHSANTPIDFLHGQAGSANKKLVLGISELPTEVLKLYKAYGFVKYHQKLFNNTDYQFFNENESLQELLFQYNHAGGFDEKVEVIIWGHSLDVSDEEYIKEIFSYNTNVEHNSEFMNVTVLYHNDSSRFSMLANLLHILGKELIERWMKKDWLKFEPVPDIYGINSTPATH